MNTNTKATLAATTDEHGVVSGICLICGTSTPLSPGGAMGRHGVDPNTLGNHAEYAEPHGDVVICIGTGHTRTFGDGRDDARRFGIRHCATAEGLAKRDTEKAEGLSYEGALDYSGQSTLVHRSLARHWRNFAIHGEWHMGMREALRNMLYEPTDSNPIRLALMHSQALAARQWIREAKWEMARVYANGVPAEDFSTMLFNV